MHQTNPPVLQPSDSTLSALSDEQVTKLRDNAVSIYRAAKRLLDANDTFPRTDDELEFAVRLREVSDAVTNLRVALAEAEKTS